MRNFSLVSVSMGYGHQRTAYPLKKFAGELIHANDYPGIPKSDRRIWETTRRGYELISKVKRIPVLGFFAFWVFDRFQRISAFYPKRDMSKPTFQLKQNYSLIKRNWGRDLIERIKSDSLVTTFFVPAFMAEAFGYPKDIYCVVCDADVARAWAPLEPQKSKIKYFAPTQRVAERLKLYGVNPEKIFLSGYPLPLENIGTQKMEVLKSDLKNRLANLDPKNIYFKKYQTLIERELGEVPIAADHPLTLMFAVGGAGAQKDLGASILWSLKRKIKEGKIKLILVAGTNKQVSDYFKRELKGLDLNEVEILYQETFEDYYAEFNKALRKTDILWTKPSELSFYSALGVPIITAPCIGSQESFNKEWLLKSGFGLSQGHPDCADQWLFDWLESGYFAECAFQGFLEGEKLGTYKILEKLK